MNQVDQSQEPSKTPGGFPDTGEHLDAIPLEPEPGEYEKAFEAGLGGGLASVEGGFIPLDSFCKGYDLIFSMLGEVTGLDTLKRVSGSTASRSAAEAVYETAKDVPWLNWLLWPESKWFQRAFALGAFSLPLYLGCREELRARDARPVNDNNAANTPEPGRASPHEDGANLS